MVSKRDEPDNKKLCLPVKRSFWKMLNCQFFHKFTQNWHLNVWGMLWLIYHSAPFTAMPLHLCSWKLVGASWPAPLHLFQGLNGFWAQPCSSASTVPWSKWDTTHTLYIIWQENIIPTLRTHVLPQQSDRKIHDS